MRAPFKKDDDMPDSDDELGDLRNDGSSARAPASVIGDGRGFIPLHKEPPRYIRVKAHNKKSRDFNRLFLAQELLGTKRTKDDEPQARAPQTAVGTKLLKGGDAIWAAEFSVDGRYLAVAGKDQVVRVFAVITTEEERRQEEEEEDDDKEPPCRSGDERLSAPVFRSKPVREFKGHGGEVLALSWSKNNFLLSSSMDKTVRLWHMSRDDCLCTFKHADLVTSIAFHPKDDRFFLAGSLDAQLRLWSIPDKSVAFSVSVQEFITAVAFSPDGKTAICGVLSGLCWFFETEGLKCQFQIHVRSSRGKNAKGSKITGIRTAVIPSSDPQSGDVKVLISSNDSRVRIYSLKTRMLEVKFRGLENQCSQINARFGDCGAYVISGSEDRKAYLWELSNSDVEAKDKQPYECFDAHPEVVTTALMAPIRTRQLLGASGDPIYDLCNPPPVMLRSMDEATISQSALSDGSHTENPAATVKKPEESPAYIERSKHLDGNIIVTTDRTGTIKVFRQDCAYNKRQQSLWETCSKFSGRVNGVGRSASIMTKTSGGSRIHSRRGSLNLGAPIPTHTHPSDRIISWRQDIEGGGSLGRASVAGTPMRNERSMSPMKGSRASMNSSAANLASEARRAPYPSSPVLRPLHPTSPTNSVQNSRASLHASKDNIATSPPTPSFSMVSVSDTDEQTKTEGGFWNLSRWRGGLSGLRYSISASAAVDNTNEVAATPAAGEAAEGSSRKQSSELLKPAEKITARKSLGVADLSRLRIGDDSNRRKSVEPTIRIGNREEPESPTKAVDEKRKRRTQSPYKKRTDSGVGQLSADSDE